MPIFALLIQGLIGAIAISLPELIRRCLISFGVGVFVFTGLNFLLSQVKDLAFGSMNGIPSISAGIIGILNIDTAFSIVMSAYGIKLTMRALGGLAPK